MCVSLFHDITLQIDIKDIRLLPTPPEKKIEYIQLIISRNFIFFLSLF